MELRASGDLEVYTFTFGWARRAAPRRAPGGAKIAHPGFASR